MRRQRARFDTTMHSARLGVENEVRLMGGRSLIISSNVPLRKDGMPYASARPPEDPAVVVYFDFQGQQVCVPCDRWTTVADNLQAIRKTIEAIRGIERWGTGEMISAVFQGFAALPEQSKSGWWAVLNIRRDAPDKDVQAAYKRMAMQNHPDRGGDPDKFIQIQDAYNEWLQEKKEGAWSS